MASYVTKQPSPKYYDQEVAQSLDINKKELETGYSNAIKRISLSTAYGLARMNDTALARLSQSVDAGHKWAIELYFKIFTQLFDKSWLSRIDLSDIQLKIDNKEDKDEVVRYLMTKLLAVGTIEVAEAKDIVKMLTTMSLNDKLSHSLANKMADEDVIKIMTMINAVKTD